MMLQNVRRYHLVSGDLTRPDLHRLAQKEKTCNLLDLNNMQPWTQTLELRLIRKRGGGVGRLFG